MVEFAMKLIKLVEIRFLALIHRDIRSLLITSIITFDEGSLPLYKVRVIIVFVRTRFFNCESELILN